MSPAAALSQPLAATRGSATLRQQPRRSLRAAKVQALAGEPREQSKATGLGPKLLGLLSAGAVLLSGTGVPPNALAAPVAVEQAAGAVKQGADKLKGGVEDAGDAIKSAASDVVDAAGQADTADQLASALTSSPDQGAGSSIRKSGLGRASGNISAGPSIPAMVTPRADVNSNKVVKDVKKGANKLKAGAEDAGDAIKSAASDVKGSAKAAARQVSKASPLGDVAEGIGANEPRTMPPVALNAGAKAAKANKEVADKIKGGAEDAGDSIKSAASDAANATGLKGVTNKIKGGAEDAGDSIKSAASDAAENTGLKGAVDALKQGASNLVGGAEDAGDSIKSAASDVADSVPNLKV